MLNIYRIDRIAHAVPSLGPPLKMLEELFGFRRLAAWHNANAGVQGVLLEVPGCAGHRWELLAPLGEQSPIQPFLDSSRGPGLLHVAVEMPDMEAAVAELGRRGLAFSGDIDRWIDASLTPPAHGPGVTFRLCGDAGTPSWGDLEGAEPMELPAPNPEAANLGIRGIDHVCQAFHNRDELAGWYEDLLGFRQVWRTPENEHPDMADLVMNVPGSSICWEIIMPRGEGSFIDKFLAGRGAAPHHVTFEVTDWEQAIQACRRHDVKTFDSNSGTTDGGDWHDTFIHPKLTGGVLVQLFAETKAGVWVRSDKTPARRA